jgi:hypothetical protein
MSWGSREAIVQRAIELELGADADVLLLRNTVGAHRISSSSLRRVGVSSVSR